MVIGVLTVAGVFGVIALTLLLIFRKDLLGVAVPASLPGLRPMATAPGGAR